MDCDKTKQISADILIPYDRSVTSCTFSARRMVGRGPPVPETLGQTDPTASKTAISNRYSLVAPQRLDIAKNVQLSLKGCLYYDTCAAYMCGCAMTVYAEHARCFQHV